MRLSTVGINPHVVAAKYAVRGALPLRAGQIEEEIKNDPSSHAFPSVTYLNIGNPQQLDQKPLTFVRQVLSLVQYPELINAGISLFPQDALDRAKILLEHIGSVGAYSHSKGVPYIRKSVADFIARRDGFRADPEQIFLSQGASNAAGKIMQMITMNDKTGILVPIPQYPLYSANTSLVGAQFLGYYLDEANDWSTSIDSIKKSYTDAKAKGYDPRLLIVINPGNPTGAVLEPEQIADILIFAKENDVVVMADEVYQENVFRDKAPPFTSFKKVRSELIEKDPSYNDVGLVSLHSTSKGFFGECGQRGGYMEVVGADDSFLDELYKLSSIELCPSVSGQVLTELMVNPPKPGEPSYEKFSAEKNTVLSTLHSRAESLYDAFNKMEGVECQRPQGAMYLFPQITIPPKAVEAAKAKGMSPDTFYAMELLNNTGICVVPGSGFGQKENTLHFRTTFLAPGGDALSKRFEDFHKKFMDTYR